MSNREWNARKSVEMWEMLFSTKESIRILARVFGMIATAK